MEKKVKSEAGAGKTADAAALVVALPLEPRPPEIIQLEKPVFIPEKEAAAAAKTASGWAAVAASNADGIKKPADYSHAAMVYDYDRDWVYEVYCMPLRTVDVRLEPGEAALEAPFVADSERWMLGAGVSQEGGAQVQHIYVKPTRADISASLIINTDRRVYHLILRSYAEIHMPLVYWRYPGTGLPFSFFAPDTPIMQGAARNGFTAVNEGDEDAPSADPRFLSFNYKITYGWFKKPRWLPRHVYDDGKKTYIEFDTQIARGAMPGIFENRSGVLNYRVYGNLIVIDKLIEEITVTLEEKEIRIRKKNG
jgi:type IV secretion system protein VirB9